MYYSGKKYGHEIGLSCCFRQHKADSHCNKFHGYALAFEFEFKCDNLDVRNWVVDFGGLKSLKGILEDCFDHKLLVASDDPMLDMILGLDELGLADVRELPAVGCEAFAEYAYALADAWLCDAGYRTRGVFVNYVKVSEHGANWAKYSEATT